MELNSLEIDFEQKNSAGGVSRHDKIKFVSVFCYTLTGGGGAGGDCTVHIKEMFIIKYCPGSKGLFFFIVINPIIFVKSLI